MKDTNDNESEYGALFWVIFVYLLILGSILVLQGLVTLVKNEQRYVSRMLLKQRASSSVKDIDPK